jgi:uncharacterized tellurite resistance protein B-like protein
VDLLDERRAEDRGDQADLDHVTETLAGELPEPEVPNAVATTGVESLEIPALPVDPIPAPTLAEIPHGQGTFESSTEAGLADHEEAGEFYNRGRTTIDLRKLAYGRDRILLMRLVNDPQFSALCRDLHGRYDIYGERRALLRKSVPIDGVLFPEIAEIKELCRQRLGLKVDVDFLVLHDNRHRALACPKSDGRVAMLLSSGLFEGFSVEELAYVIGHELGHFLLNHGEYPLNRLLRECRSQLTAQQVIDLFQWARAGEVSADRMGLLLSRSFEASVSAMFKLSTGVRSRSIPSAIAEWVSRIAAVPSKEPELLAGLADWFSILPVGPMRTKALHLFFESELFLKGQGQALQSRDHIELDRKVDEFWEITDPNIGSLEPRGAAFAQKFLFLSGHAVALANGQFDESEAVRLGSLVPDDIFQAASRELGGFDRSNPEQFLHVLIGKAEELAPDLKAHVSYGQRLGIIQNLSILACVDGQLDDPEVTVLYHLCQLIGIFTEFADQVLYGAGIGLD